MPPHFRKLLVTFHVAISVGWLGAILPYLILALRGISAHDLQSQRAALNTLVLLGDKVLIPLSLAALCTGLILSLATRWGLVRHWWIVAKLALTLFSTGVLLEHMHHLRQLAALLQSAAPGPALARAGKELIVHPTGGLIVLLAVTAISVLKPWGMTPWGRRVLLQRSPTSPPRPHLVALRAVSTRSPRLFWIGVTGAHAVALAIMLHVGSHVIASSFHLH